MLRGQFLLLLLVASPAHADRGFALLAVEGWNDADRPAHGVLLLAHETEAAPGAPRYSAELNTDTARLGVDGVRVALNVQAGLRLTGELFFAGLLTDYYRDGESDLGRGFEAHYAGLQAWLKARVAPRTCLEGELGGRRFFFHGTADTDPALALPPSTFILEPRARLTWWGLADDAGWRDRHRLYPRVEGLAAGVQLGVDLRDTARAWGARDAGAFERPDLRNDPETVSPSVQTWLDWGWAPSSAVRVQVSERAGWLWGGDDLTRARAGGLTPYVVPIVGVPWAHYLTDGYGGLTASAHLRLPGDLEAGPLVNAAWLRDVHRDGDDALALVWGAGALLDWRDGPYQIDARAGWSPSLASASGKAALSALVAGGLVFE